MPMIISLFMIFFVAPSFADRSVSIAADNGTIKLVNGSDVTVTYDVECYDSSTGNNIESPSTGLTIAAKAEAFHGADPAKCASGAIETDLGSFARSCNGSKNSVNYAAAAALCETGSHVCTIQDIATHSPNYASMPKNDDYWINANVDPFSTQCNGCKKYNDQATSGKKPFQPAIRGNKTTNDFCAGGSTGGGPVITHCQAHYTTNNLDGALCCPDVAATVASCKVTIKSATPASGFLQSPQFKGGSAF